ncbi:acyl-CoA dehydrogenase family protein [Serpentinimonas maccroryi]|uniref:acyl-CoA dehydrogenase family protein n=1 Tax=Serpentinimonas maccroryi TaxID=1458426 RepID=UPI0020335B79|nr:acyl-CoA dehydrogenase family protein [Serpentinimonas maccroryi]MCM2479039.1 acyl-CoA dehydrogenase [Serpentinimonas maccroryi]
MDFDFSDEQLQLREAVQRWVHKAYPFERRCAATAAGGFDRVVWNELAELGLCALTVSDAHDGLGLGAVEAMLVQEELGRGLVLEPLEQTFVAASVLQAFAPASVQTQWLPRLASGAALLVLAHVERGLRHRLGAVATQAVAQPATGQTEPQGEVWLLDGAKSLVPAGDCADAFLVPAQTAHGLALFLVQRSAAGVQTRAYQTQDGSRAAEVGFAHSPAQLLSADGLAALEWAADVGIAAACAQGVGVMEQTLSLTLGYLNTRQQFGVPIASFQALRHRVADMKMQLELARSMSYYATLKLGAPAPERRQALARAKVQLGQSMRFVGQQAVQLHGGIGVTDEYIGSHCFKKLTQLELTLGDTLHHLDEVSARMGASAGVFA